MPMILRERRRGSDEEFNKVVKDELYNPKPKIRKSRESTSSSKVKDVVVLPKFEDSDIQDSWTSDVAARHLKENWTNPVSPVSFLGVVRIYNFYQKKLTMSNIKRILSTIDSWSLMKQSRVVKKKLNNFMSFNVHDFWMADSFDVSELQKYNYGIKHLFCVIDVFSRKAFVIPLVTHTAVDGIQAIGKVISQAGSLPGNFGSDKGGECGSHKVQNFLKSLGVNPVILSGPSKASHVEIFQKTLQRMIYTFISEHDNLSFINFLPFFVNAYNERIHTTTNYSPNATLKSQSIQRSLRNINLERKVSNKVNQRKPTLKIGDWVRISLKKTSFHRSYNIQNTYEKFRVYKIKVNNYLPRYFIKEEDGSLIEGSFTRNELTKVNLELYKVSVVGKKKVKGKEMVLLDYKGYAPKYRQWVLAK